jgi:hypothetical protein
MEKERVAIIGGTGDQGKGLALRWAKAGYAITLGSRDAARAQAAADEFNALLGSANINSATNAEAAASALIVVLTIPFAAQIATLKDLTAAIQPGALVVDVTVPLEPAVGGKPTRMLGVWAGSAAEQCREYVPAHAEVVSAFHNVGADALADLAHDVACDILVCGDKKDAKERVRPLVESIAGCRYVDAGLLAQSRTVESLTSLLIGVNIRYKKHSGVRITGLF